MVLKRARSRSGKVRNGLNKGVSAILLLISACAITAEPASGRVLSRSYYQMRLESPDTAQLHSYDVISYHLYMDWYNVLMGRSQGFDGKMEITLVPSLQVPLDSIRLDNDPAYLTVDSAFLGGSRLLTNSAGGKLTIFLEQPLAAGGTGVIDLYYHVIDSGVTPSLAGLQKGFYVYYKGEKLSNGNAVPETVAYTMSEPSDARYWMPCYDEPSDKALCSIVVRVPIGFRAASNGTLDSTIDVGDSCTVFYWREDYPISTYLMCATAARFSLVQRTMTIDGKSIPVQYYVYPADSLEAESGAECNIDSVVSMIKFYSSIYGNYPFDKYGMTGVEPFGYGGMEHQTITTMNRNHEFDRRDVAHELAHQWWGDMVTLGTWKDIWLNESFATYSEAMQLQHLSQTQFGQEMQMYAAQFFIEDSTRLRYPIYAPPPAKIFGLAEYYKGAWVLNMLRGMLGDSTFFGVLRRYRADYQYGNAVTADFENVVDTVANADLSWFFNEWIFDQGYPVYTASFTQSGDSVDVTINQIQTDAPIFKMPIDVGIYAGGNMTVVPTVMDSLDHQTFRLYHAGHADSIMLDPFGKLLALYPGQARSNPTKVGASGNGPNNFYLLQNYPNPFNGMTNVEYSLSEPGIVTVELFDVLGRKVETLVHGYQSQGSHDIKLNAGSLASGVYMCRLLTPYRATTIKLVLEK